MPPPGPLASTVSQYALPTSTGTGSLQNQTPSSPASVSYLFGSVLATFRGASSAAAPFATRTHQSYACDCRTSVSTLSTLPWAGSSSLTQNVDRPSTVCQPVGEALPSSKS